MSDCLFCKIVAGEIPCDKVFENELLIAVKDYQQRERRFGKVSN